MANIGIIFKGQKSFGKTPVIPCGFTQSQAVLATQG